MAEHNYISSYPLYTLKGHPFQRQETIIIDWMSSIPTFLQKDVHPYTIYLLTLISLGYDLKQLLEIKWDDISDKLNDNELKQFIYHNLRFNQDSNPYIFQGKRKDKISSLDRVTSITKKDQDKFPFSLTPRKLRQSYILSLVSNLKYSDEQLMSQLHISSKSLGYYKFCSNYYELIPYNRSEAKKS